MLTHHLSNRNAAQNAIGKQNRFTKSRLWIWLLSPIVLFTFFDVQAQEDEWLEWAVETELFLEVSTVASSDPEEKNMAVGDLNNDGNPDMVVVRKQPFSASTEPPKTDLLLINEGGVLVDRTAELAPDFLTEPTHARYVIIHDMDGDGWEDVIIANTFLQQPKYYANLGNDGQGNWLGLEDQSSTRFPELTDDLILFCAVWAGDVTGDGAPDLYFANYKQGGGQGVAKDFLLINDGTGHFTNESESRLGDLRNSAFGTAVEIADMDGDGDMDIVKVTTLFNVPPWNSRGVIVMFNDGTGNFSNWQNVAPFAPYMITIGDFSQNGFNDIFVVDDGNNYVISVTDAIPDQSLTYTQDAIINGTSGFAGNVHAADLDLDGDLDIIISDVDVDIPPCQSNRRIMILQNNDGVFTEMYKTGFHPWVTNSYDVGILDINGDGLPDFVNGKCQGYDVVMNKTCELAPNSSDYDGDGLPDACDPCPTNPDPDCEPSTDYPVIDTSLAITRQWNEMLLASIRRDLARPPVHARNLYHHSMMMWDTWAIIYNQCTRLIGQDLDGYFSSFAGFPEPEDKEAAFAEAVSYASYRLLKHRFVNSPNVILLDIAYDEHMATLGYDISNTDVDYTSGSAAALGNYIAQEVINYGAMDNSNEAIDFDNLYYEPINPPLSVQDPGNPDIVDLNRWQPLTLQIFIDQSGNVIPGATPPFLAPEWGQVSNFALSDYDEPAIYERDEFDYVTFLDPGDPPYLELDGSGTSDQYQWTFLATLIWSAHLDPDDGEMWDISPATRGNLEEMPATFAEHPDYYNLMDGSISYSGYPVNPATEQPYTPNVVPRGDYTRVLAEYWADGPDSETPPGHWFRIFNRLVTDHPMNERKVEGEGDELDEDEWNVKAYLTLGGAVHDAAVSAWGVKGWYDYIRPISAIRAMAQLGQSSNASLSNYHPAGIPLIPDYVEVVEEGDPLAGPANVNVGKIKVFAWRGHSAINNVDTEKAGVDWILAERWVPYQRSSFVTPPFAGYVSGHSTFSRAAAEAITAFTGDDYFPGGMGTFLAEANEFLVFENGPSVDVELQWARYQDAADESALSRIWGGIHPPADDIPGRVMGIVAGQSAFTKAKALFDECEPSEELCEDAPSGLNSVVLSHGVVLNWNSVPGSVGCRVRGSRIGFPGIRTIDIPVAGINQLYVSGNQLAPNATYEWRVICACQVNPFIATPWSEYDYFTTGSSIANAPDEDISSESFTVNVFPNPSQGIINVHSNISNYFMDVYDLSGKKVMQYGEVNSANASIDLSSLSAGIYFMRLVSDEAVETKQIVIN